MSQSTQAQRVHLGRAVDALLAATAALQAVILNEPAHSAALVPIVLRLSAYTDQLDGLVAETYAPTAPESHGAA